MHGLKLSEVKWTNVENVAERLAAGGFETISRYNSELLDGDLMHHHTNKVPKRLISMGQSYDPNFRLTTGHRL